MKKLLLSTIFIGLLVVGLTKEAQAKAIYHCDWKADNIQRAFSVGFGIDSDGNWWTPNGKFMVEGKVYFVYVNGVKIFFMARNKTLYFALPHTCFVEWV